MALIDGDVRNAVAAIAALTDCNPFVPERMALEQRVLGHAFLPIGLVWSAEDDVVSDPNIGRLRERVESLVGELRQRLASGAAATTGEIADYRGAVFYLLWLRYEDDLLALVEPDASEGPAAKKVTWYDRYAHDVRHFLSPLPDRVIDPAHLFALGFQTRRAFHHIFRQIFGASVPAAQLRADVWQSIFTHDPGRYRAALYNRMADIPTLITGESGTGKELVARAIALSQYIPFDAASQTFAADADAGFAAVNLAALNPTLIESEIFGHRRGAFTGAVDDHDGWLERCGPHGAVFLDEIGELDTAIQVKLLRVLQSRDFHRIGETTSRRFAGKVIAATHRDLEQGRAEGRFRDDFYYRLCADRIHVPALREALVANPDDLRNLLLIASRRIAGADHGPRLANEVEAWIVEHLGADYPWPGNMRELEQCVRNVLVHGAYRPRRTEHQPSDDADELAATMRAGTLSADDLVGRYAELLYAKTGNLHETARVLGIDWRTVRAKLREATLTGEGIRRGDAQKAERTRDSRAARPRVREVR